MVHRVDNRREILSLAMGVDKVKQLNTGPCSGRIYAPSRTEREIVSAARPKEKAYAWRWTLEGGGATGRVAECGDVGE